MSEIHYISKEKLDELKAELRELIGAGRKQIAERLQEAISFGDLSENAEFSEAKDAQAMLERRIKELQIILANYKLIQQGKATGKVGIGSRVRIKHEKLRSIDEFIIVGPEEATPEERKISHESPLGKQLLNRGEGEQITVETPEG